MKTNVQFMLFAAVAAQPYYEQASSSYSADFTNCVVNYNGQAYTVGTDQGCTPTSADVYSTEVPDVYPTTTYEVTSYPVSSSEYPESTPEESYPVTSESYPTESAVYSATSSEYPVIPPPASYDTTLVTSSSNAAYPTTYAVNSTSYIATATGGNSYSSAATTTAVETYPSTTKAATSASAVATAGAGASTHGSSSMLFLVGIAAAVFAL